MITSEIVLLRHGQAHCNAAGLVGGPATCTGLTDLGRHQVEQAAELLAAEHAASPFTALYAGPRLRLQQTGQILALAMGLQLLTDPGFDGPEHGDADGRPWREVKDSFGGAPHTRPDTPWARGSDTWNGYLQRAGAHLRKLLTRHQTGRLLLAAHGETVIAAHVLLLGLPLGSVNGFSVDHASLTRWQHHRNQRGQQRWLLHSHNNTAHLAPPPEQP